MCGIAGIFSYRNGSSKIDEEELIRIRESMALRGPDGSGLWISNTYPIGLAHRRLSIIDLTDAGAQPMSSLDGTLQITFNGEIYNYRELRKELENKGVSFNSKSDTEVLLYLYSEHGPEMVNKLRGMFAFAIWDEKKKGLFLARDHLGIKPLYFADDGYTFRFASQVKALLSSGKINTSIEAAGHVGFFLWGYSPEPYTFYKAIRALESGTTLWINELGKTEIRNYFNVTKLFSSTAAENVEPAQLLDKLKNALTDSVKNHMIADVPVGLFLSSGLDSTVLAGLISNLGYKDLKTTTLSFDEFSDTEQDESKLAEKIAKHFTTNHQTIRLNLTNSSFNENMDRIFQAMDQPSIDGINTYFVCKAAVQTGLKVALSGLGGDEIFCGYPTFKQIPKIVCVSWPFSYLPQFGKGIRWVSSNLFGRYVKPRYASLFEYGATEASAYMLLRSVFLPWELSEVLDPDLICEGWQQLDPLSSLEETTTNIRSSKMKISALEMVWYMRNQLLRTADWAGMANSIEIRVPFVDIDLLRALLPLMASINPPSKIDMVRCTKIPLFEELLKKPKKGFRVPFENWFSKMHIPFRKSESEYKNWARFVYERSGFKN